MIKRIVFIAFVTVAGVQAAVIQTARLSAQQVVTPFDKIKVKQSAFENMTLNEITPNGWIADRIRFDLGGFVGHLDSLVPDLIINDDIYGKDRLTKKHKSKNLGNNSEGAEWEVQYLWWNSETQSNWWDGYIRNAFLADSPEHIGRVKNYVAHILSTQDKDGYLGIYDSDLRYNFDTANGENGELWSKASLYRGLIAYYEFTGDKKVFNAVKRGVDNVLSNWRINESSPFGVKKSSAGLCHGLVFTDVLDYMYKQTKDEKYLDYGLFLYKDYSSYAFGPFGELSEPDIQYSNIINPDYKLKGHGVHTYEHIRPLLLACYASSNPQLEQALDIYLQRIDSVTTPTGGAIGDEWIFGRKANATFTGYEYCSLHELLDAYCSLMQKTGNLRYADKVENIFFNAASGARHPEKSAIAYCKTDNSYRMTGGNNFSSTSAHKQTRFKYSPAHQDIAVCCVPNAGRITPYYVQNMFMKDKDGIVAVLFGGCDFHTVVGKSAVSVKEITNYPFEPTVTFEITADRQAQFSFKIRKPVWSKGFTANFDYTDEGGYITVKCGAGTQTLTVEWKAEVEKHIFGGEVYFTYGALVLALPVKAVEKPAKIYADGFADYEYIPENFTIFEYADEMPVVKDGRFFVNLYNSVWQKKEQKELLPVGKTVLRQVTF
ncbi:MAG: glycoside hydrolase family 127 protein [Bacteroidales bacterium]|jgi:DUF1680 family protein|nr:glycoside hydrolase family 127 protein [Bacteroidales bacterium]